MNTTQKRVRIGVRDVFRDPEEESDIQSSPETVKSDDTEQNISDQNISTKTAVNKMNEMENMTDLRRLSLKPKESNAYNEYVLFQKDIQNRMKEFSRLDDFSRYLDLGMEFSEAPLYSSRKKVKDLLGFEYSIPPKEKTISARMKGKLAEWVAEEVKMHEEELAIHHFLSGNTLPFRIDDLKYDVEESGENDYDTYYQKIKELSYAEKQLDEKLQNTANSALITGGNVAYGKAISDTEGNLDFEKKNFIDSDDDFELYPNRHKKTLKRKIAKVAINLMKGNKFDESKDNDLEYHSSGEKNAHKFKSKNYLSLKARRKKNDINSSGVSQR